MKTYRCRHAVEAAQWIDTDANREALCDWFAEHDALFCTLGSVVKLPMEGEVAEGEWIVIDSDDEIMAMSDQDFRRDYEEVA